MRTLFLFLATVKVSLCLVIPNSTPKSRKQSFALNYKNSADEGQEFVKMMPMDQTIIGPHATKHRKWGVDNVNADEYWFNSNIHTLGNNGIMGAFHAAVAPLCTLLIDVYAYDGIDIRLQVADELSKSIKTSRARVLDLCCGVGMSTRALQKAFPNAEAVIGVDTSPEMLAMAEWITEHIESVEPWVEDKLSQSYDFLVDKGQMIESAARSCAAKYTQANAETTGFPAKSFNLVTVMYGFHEAPFEGRQNILKEARRVLQPGGLLAVIDISSDYTPNASMLSGEPYVLEYQENIDKQLKSASGFTRASYKTIVPGHVGMWVLKRV